MLKASILRILSRTLIIFCLRILSGFVECSTSLGERKKQREVAVRILKRQAFVSNLRSSRLRQSCIQNEMADPDCSVVRQFGSGLFGLCWVILKIPDKLYHFKDDQKGIELRPWLTSCHAKATTEQKLMTECYRTIANNQVATPSTPSRRVSRSKNMVSQPQNYFYLRVPKGLLLGKIGLDRYLYRWSAFTHRATRPIFAINRLWSSTAVVLKRMPQTTTFPNPVKNWKTWWPSFPYIRASVILRNNETTAGEWR